MDVGIRAVVAADQHRRRVAFEFAVGGFGLVELRHEIVFGAADEIDGLFVHAHVRFSKVRFVAIQDGFQNRLRIAAVQALIADVQDAFGFRCGETSPIGR